MNISCETCRERWDELFNDSPLGASQPEATQASEPAGVREHLAQCAQCRSEFALLKAAREELHAFPAMAAPLDLRARIRQQLEAEAVAPATTAPVSALAPTLEEVERHRAQIESKILEGTSQSWKQTPAQRLQRLWERFRKSLRHPATMALSSGAALLLICFVSLNTFQPDQAPQETAPGIAGMKAEDTEEIESDAASDEKSQQEPAAVKTRKAPPARAASKENTARPSTPGRKGNSTGDKPRVANGAEVELPAPRSDEPAIWKVAPPPPQPPRPLPQGDRTASPPKPAMSAPVNPIPAAPRDESAGNAVFKAQPAPLPAAGAPAAAQSAATQSAAPPAAAMARENQDMAVEANQADNARAAGAVGMAQRAPELRAVPDKSSSPKRYLARRRAAAERIEASITAPRHIGNAEVVVELPEEAQFTDGSRSRVLWRGSVRKDESIAVKFEAEVEPEADNARVVLKETKDGETETVAYKEVPVSEAGRRRSR